MPGTKSSRSTRTVSAKQILGQTGLCQPADIPKPVDIVNVFRPDAGHTADRGTGGCDRRKGIWLQLGIANDEAARIATEGGLAVVMDRCISTEHGRLVNRSGPGSALPSQSIAARVWAIRRSSTSRVKLRSESDGRIGRSELARCSVSASSQVRRASSWPAISVAASASSMRLREVEFDQKFEPDLARVLDRLGQPALEFAGPASVRWYTCRAGRDGLLLGGRADPAVPLHLFEMVVQHPGLEPQHVRQRLTVGEIPRQVVAVSRNRRRGGATQGSRVPPASPRPPSSPSSSLFHAEAGIEPGLEECSESRSSA